MNWFVRKKTKGDSQLRALLNQWEQQTLIGSEYSFRQQYSVALKYFTSGRNRYAGQTQLPGQ